VASWQILIESSNAIRAVNFFALINFSRRPGEMNCLSLADLLDYLRGEADAPQRAAAAAHLSTGCPHCLANQKWLTELGRLASEDRSSEFPEPVIASVVARFKQQTAASRKPLRQLIAEVIFDSLFPQQLAPARSGVSSESSEVSRQVLYHAEGYDIDLRFERAEDDQGEDLIGQILASHKERAALVELTVQLLRDETEAARTQTSQRGIFRFTKIPAGACDLRIQVPEGEISIPRLSIARDA
jgi:hypothetical protein